MTIYLEPAQVPAALRGAYDGKKFAVHIVESVTVPFDAGLWSGGSRDHYSLIWLTTGAALPMPGQNASPWDNDRREHVIPLKPDYAIARHTIFCGKDMGLTFYIHPDNAAQLLPAPAAELPPIEKLVLKYTKERKASYNGQDRYAMAASDWRYYGKDWQLDAMPSRDDWQAAKEALIAGGYLNKAGAITVKGKNAI